jgi:hypothetical protein
MMVERYGIKVIVPPRTGNYAAGIKPNNDKLIKTSTASKTPTRIISKIGTSFSVIKDGENFLERGC